jgi:hypothetical protein
VLLERPLNVAQRRSRPPSKIIRSKEFADERVNLRFVSPSFVQFVKVIHGDPTRQPICNKERLNPDNTVSACNFEWLLIWLIHQ